MRYVQHMSDNIYCITNTLRRLLAISKEISNAIFFLKSMLGQYVVLSEFNTKILNILSSFSFMSEV